MSIPTVAVNENSPAGSDNIADGDDKIREFKTQNREILEIDHEYPSSGQSATAGQHKQVTLQTKANLGTGASSAAILGMQGTAPNGQLVLTTEADSDIVVCNTTGINAPSITGVYAAATVSTMATMLAFIYPVGSIYMNADATIGAQNPATTFGFGTWVAMVDEVVVGKNSSGTFDTLGTLAAGEETHTLTTTEMPAHVHTVATRASRGDNAGADKHAQTGQDDGTMNTGSAGSDGAHNNIQPTYVAYMWRRTA